ncbi:MAG TPA: hypothetical protein VF192_18030 [Longimicrobiales bacterium]
MRHARLLAAVGGPGREAALVALLLLLIRPALLPDPRPAVGSFNDDAIYVALGSAIAEGHGYRSLYLPGDPVQVRYPPGLPAVLALLWRIGGTLDAVTELALALNAGLIALAAGLLYWLARTRLRLHPALAAGFGVGPFLLDASLLYSRLILSEPYFVAGWAAALVLGYRVAEQEPGHRRVLAALALGLVLAATALARSQGLALVPALLAALVLKRVDARAVAAATAGALVPIAAWQWVHARWVAAGPLSTAADEVSYLAWTGIESVRSAIRTLGGAAVLNAARYTVIFSEYFGDLVLGGLLLVVSLVVLAVAGAVRRFRSDPGLVLGTAAAAAVTAAWPFTQDRLVLPLLPFIGLLAATEVARLLRSAGPRGRAILTAVLCAAAASVAIRQVTLRHHVNARLAAGAAADYYTPTDYVRRTSRLLLGLTAWVRANTLPEDRIMAALTGGVYLHTGRKALPAAPAQPIIGSRVFRTPGAYLAGQILAEQPTVLVVHWSRKGRADIARDVDAVRAHCPGVLMPLRPAPAGFPAAYRIRANVSCLGALVRGAATGQAGRQ